MDHARFSGGAVSEAVESGDADGAGAQRHGLDHVAAAQNPAVDNDFGLAIDRRHHLRKHVQGAAAVVQLASAVVGDVHHLYAVLHREPGVLCGGDALDDQRDVEAVADTGDVFPREAALVLFVETGGLTSGGGETLGHVPFALDVVVQIDGEAECNVARVHGAADVILHPRLVAAHVKLKDLRAVAGGGGLLESGLAHRAGYRNGAKPAGCPGRARASIRIEVLEGANRSQHHRDAQLVTQKARRHVDVVHVAQHPRAKRNGVQRGAVAPEGGLGFRRADEIVPHPVGKILFGRLVKLVEQPEVVALLIHRQNSESNG